MSETYKQFCHFPFDRRNGIVNTCAKDFDGIGGEIVFCRMDDKSLKSFCSKFLFAEKRVT